MTIKVDYEKNIILNRIENVKRIAETALNKNQVAYAQISKVSESVGSNILKMYIDPVLNSFVFEKGNKRILIDMNNLGTNGLLYLEDKLIADLLTKQDLEEYVPKTVENKWRWSDTNLEYIMDFGSEYEQRCSMYGSGVFLSGNGNELRLMSHGCFVGSGSYMEQEIRWSNAANGFEMVFDYYNLTWHRQGETDYRLDGFRFEGYRGNDNLMIYRNNELKGPVAGLFDVANLVPISDVQGPYIWQWGPNQINMNENYEESEEIRLESHYGSNGAMIYNHEMNTRAILNNDVMILQDRANDRESVIENSMLRLRDDSYSSRRSIMLNNFDGIPKIEFEADNQTVNIEMIGGNLMYKGKELNSVSGDFVPKSDILWHWDISECGYKTNDTSYANFSFVGLDVVDKGEVLIQGGIIRLYDDESPRNLTATIHHSEMNLDMGGNTLYFGDEGFKYNNLQVATINQIPSLNSVVPKTANNWIWDGTNIYMGNSISAQTRLSSAGLSMTSSYFNKSFQLLNLGSEVQLHVNGSNRGNLVGTNDLRETWQNRLLGFNVNYRDYTNGYVAPANPMIVTTRNDGVCEISRMLDFHDQSRHWADYDVRMYSTYKDSNQSALDILAGRGAWINGRQIQVSQTILHITKPEEPFENYIVGKPCFSSGKNVRFELERIKIESGEDKHNYHWHYDGLKSDDCICSIITDSTVGGYVGIITEVHPERNYVVFATHGDFLMKVDDVDKYALDDVILWDGSILNEDAILTTKIMKSIVGNVTGKYEDYLCILKT